MEQDGSITQLLASWHAGDGAALEKLVPYVHRQLRLLARKYLQRDRLNQTLQPTALVNEAWLRLLGPGPDFAQAHYFLGAAYWFGTETEPGRCPQETAAVTITARRIVICISASALLVVSAVPLFVGGRSLSALASRMFPGQDVYNGQDDIYLSVSFFGLGLATALSLVYCLWYRHPTKTSVITAYFAFLIVLTSMSAANFSMVDVLISRRAQAFVDLVLVILGLIVVVELLKISPTSTYGFVLRGVILFMVVLQGIALPGMYGLLWLLNWQNAITAGGSTNFNPGWISGVAACASAIVAVLNYRSSQRLARDKDAERKLIR